MPKPPALTERIASAVAVSDDQAFPGGACRSQKASETRRRLGAPSVRIGRGPGVVRGDVRRPAPPRPLARADRDRRAHRSPGPFAARSPTTTSSTKSSGSSSARARWPSRTSAYARSPTTTDPRQGPKSRADGSLNPHSPWARSPDAECRDCSPATPASRRREVRTSAMRRRSKATDGAQIVCDRRRRCPGPNPAHPAADVHRRSRPPLGCQGSAAASH